MVRALRIRREWRIYRKSENYEYEIDLSDYADACDY